MMKFVRNLAAVLALAGAGTASWAQFGPPSDEGFKPGTMQRVLLPSVSCTGFWKTPSFKCEDIQVPAYMALTAFGDRRALTLVSPGAGGLDRRHSDYAQALAESGINALVLDHWTARGLINAQGDYQKSRAKGGDAVNYAIDILAITTQLKQQDEWKDAKIGYIGESMGGSAAINITRPYIEAIVQERMNLPVFSVHVPDVAVALYPGCIDRSDIERFKSIPLLIVVGDKDDQAPPAICEKQTAWMNARGGDVTFKVLSGESHDWDAPFHLKMIPAENTSGCANTRIGNKFVLESNGMEYPGTPEGFRDMRNDCRTRGHLAGNRGNPRAGYDIWLAYLSKTLLNK